MKSGHISKKSRKNIQSTKEMDFPVKFVVEKIFRFAKYNLLSDTKNNRQKMNKTVKGDILKFSNSGRLIQQYLVIFPNEKGHNLHYTGEAASIIQPINERVADCIKLQIREM